MIFDKPTFDKLFKGCSIIDVAIQSKNRQCYVLKIKSKNIIRFICTCNDEVEMKERYHGKWYSNISDATISFSDDPLANYVSVSSTCHVYSYDIEHDDLENKLPEALPDANISVVIQNTVCINETIYAVGYPNKMFKRIGRNNWEDITQSIAQPKDLDEASGFVYFWKDADGFSNNHIYAVGGEGEVWHFNSKIWKQIPFVNDDWLCNVCCAGDDNVYVGGQGKALYVWNGKEWKIIKSASGIDTFKDIKWFKGKLYCGSESDLMVLENEELVYVKTPYPQGRIDISPDGNYMIVAGKLTAHLFDGDTWETIING